VPIYISNNNENNNNVAGGNQNKDGEQHNAAKKLTGGAIAGITVACTVIGTVIAAMGVWYARRSARAAEKNKEGASTGLPSSASQSARVF